MAATFTKFFLLAALAWPGLARAQGVIEGGVTLPRPRVEPAGDCQWAELRKGVTSRMQWHLLALHGYQFFDLDDREPDTVMINWTSSGLVPHLYRCREGADDLRFAVTLWNLAQKNKASAAAQEASAWLEQVSRQIPINARSRPAGFMDDETFRAICITKIRQLLPPQ
jgi:hypothetical protein